MRKINLLRIFLSGYFLFLVAGYAWAKEDPVVMQSLNGALGQLKVDSTRTVEDSRFFDNSYDTLLNGPDHVQNKVMLRINEASPFFLKTEFYATAVVRVTFTTDGGVVDSNDITFNIYYTTDGSYGDRSICTFSDAYRVKIRVLSLTSNVAWNVWPSLILENELQSFPSFKFSCTGNAIQTVSTASLDSLTTLDELPVSWPNVEAADEYDLEWTYVDSSALRDSVYGDPSAPGPNAIFENSTTRVTIAKNYYKIPILYDGAGTLFYRVRPVQTKYPSGRTEAAWSSDFTAGLGAFYFKGHERSLNWQATTSYAEEGKRKVVVQYYDGSLRARQTVTKDNTTDSTIIAESIYDYQGRPVIQVLPAPSLNAVIQYSRNFNSNISGDPYDKQDFDSLPASSTCCTFVSPGMSADSGASRYYSPKNPRKTLGFNRYIPNANGYPFTQVEYTPDNTGRISRQGGLDTTYRLGSGHETKYYYGTPDQQELDALFGTEVGDKSHYFKTMVRDANGQYSVSYADMHGRTIATALADTVARGMKMDVLPSWKKREITETLADPNSAVIKDLVMESKKGLLVATTDFFRFHYQLQPDSIRIPSCEAKNICYDCLYDLRITITGDCSADGESPQPFYFDTLVQNFSMAPFDTVNNLPANFSFDFTKKLSQGSYEITKQLSVSRQAMEYYRDSIFMKTNTCVSLDSLVNVQRQLLATAECLPTCSSCLANLGSFAGYFDNYRIQAGVAIEDTATIRSDAEQAYLRAQDACNNLCGQNKSAYNDIRDQMLLDMVPPSGQYANPDTLYRDIYSIFYVDIVASPTSVPAYQNSSITYLDENGKADSVYDEKTGAFVLPQQLSIDAFANNFKLSWAEALLKYHPEKCKLDLMQPDSLTHRWDLRFAETETYAEAIAKGYLNPTAKTGESAFTKYNATGTADYDPISGGQEFAIEDSIRHYRSVNSSYVSMWALATMTTKCNGKPNGCALNYTGNDSAFNTGTTCAGDLDMAWRSFRQTYLAAKHSVMSNKYKTSTSPCTPPFTAKDLYDAKHQPHFGDIVEMMGAASLPADTTQAKAQAADSANAYYDANCMAYSQGWREQLQSCYSGTTLDTIIARMVKVCKEGSDAAHPFGASSVKPSSSYSYRSFEQVLSGFSVSDVVVCNAYQINYPKPYDQQPAYSNKPVWTRPADCECERITTLHDNYLTLTATYGSFSNYLLQVYKTTISDSVLNLLLSQCAVNPATAACVNLTTPIQLPPVLQCNTGDVCISCQQFEILDTEFKNKYPGILPSNSGSPDDSIQIARNNLYEQFLNYKTGFSKTAAEYLGFAALCPAGGSEGSGSQASKDSLNQLKIDYSRYNGSIRHLDASGCDTTYWRVNFGGTFSYNAGVPLGEIFQNGIAQLPAYYTDTLDPGLSPGYDYLNDTICVDTAGFTWETRVKLPDSLINGAGHFFGSNWWYWLYTNNEAAGWILAGTNYGGGVALHTHVKNGDPLHTYVDTGTAPLSYDNWRTVKIVFRGSKFSFYLDDQFLLEKTMDAPVSELYGWSLSPYSLQGQIDYVKVYDSSNRILYWENFNGCDQMAYKTALGSECRDCETSFTNFYNHSRGTTLSYPQIDSVYLNNTGRHLDVCPTTACNELNQIKDDYLQYAGSVRHLDASGCDTTHNKVNFGGGFHNAVVPLGEIFKDGIAKLPSYYADTLTQYSGAHTDFDHFNDTLCIDSSGFTFETRLKLPDSLIIPNGYGSNNGDNFWIWLNSTSASGNFFAATQPDNGEGAAVCTHKSYHSTDPLEYCRDFNVPGQHFNDWKTVKLQFRLRTWKYFVGDSLMAEGALDAPMTNLYMWSVIAFSFKAQIDYIKIYDVYNNMLYNEEFNGCSAMAYSTAGSHCSSDCGESFTRYFNAIKAANYSKAQVDSIYMVTCGVLPYVCPSATQGLTLCGRSEPLFNTVDINTITNCSDSSFFIMNAAIELQKVYRDSLLNKFDSAYRAKCMKAYQYEQFTVKHAVSEYHHTLYYYDQAGNLLKTVPPAGVRASYDSLWLDSVKIARNNHQVKVPAHSMATQYRYNTLNQVVTQQTPDAGKSGFWYDRLGRLVLSQNAKQKAVSGTETGRQYSYTLYDYLGRIYEVGQITNSGSTLISDTISRKPQNLSSWLTASVGGKEQITQTIYDTAYIGWGEPVMGQRNLRNRVSFTTYTVGNNPANYNHGTFYTYDIHGNVDTLLQDFGSSSYAETRNPMNSNGNRWKKMTYRYDLISGKVNHVAYQPHLADQYFHRYRYDAENRLTLVETSYDSVYWDKEARYEYYKHGPLARVVLGDLGVQGVDYAYTLQGWLKGINSTSVVPGFDMGGDGDTTRQNRHVARDLYGIGLNYYGADYRPIDSTLSSFAPISTQLSTSFRPLYNGNISSISSNLAPFYINDSYTWHLPLLYNYTYDQLNRLTAMDTYHGLNQTTNSWSGLTYTKDYRNRFQYDANGNITKQVRYANNTAADPYSQDSMAYIYTAGTNRLAETRDSAWFWDIQRRDFAYDEIGNLIKDSSLNIPLGGIKWNAYGKLTDMRSANRISWAPQNRTRYNYDASGNKVGKYITEYNSPNASYTYYVNDASGNVMAGYVAYGDTSAPLSNMDLVLKFWNLYGSSRLGMQSMYYEMDGIGYTNPSYYSPWRGQTRDIYRAGKYYELTNHLGNMMVQIKDIKLGIPKIGDSTYVAYFRAVSQEVDDYYPFGLPMTERAWTHFEYRYGFNGKENEMDFREKGKQLDYGERIYDAQLGRFLSVDPLQKIYPMLSTYQYAGNSPISGVDLDGLEFRYYNLKNEPGSDFKSHLGIDKQTKVVDRTIKTAVTINSYPKPELIMPGTKFTSPVLGLNDQWNFSFSLKMSDVKLSPVVVSPDGKTWRVLPDNFDLDDLPPLSDPIWNNLETPDEFLEGRMSEASGIAKKAISYSQAISAVTSVLSTKIKVKPERYDGPKPKYHVNPKHVNPKNSKITPLPNDAEDVFTNAIPGDPSKPKHWYGKNADGAIYRYSNANDGTAHFSGRSDQGDGIVIPQYVKERLGLNQKK